MIWTPSNREPTHRHVITKAGKSIACCYADCEKPGYDDIRIMKPSLQRQGDNAIYIFCSDEHKRAYLAERKGVH